MIEASLCQSCWSCLGRKSYLHEHFPRVVLSHLIDLSSLVMSVATNGVVLATQKKLPSTLVDETSFSKIYKLDDHIGLVYSGMGQDTRVLVNKGRKAAQTVSLSLSLSISFFTHFAYLSLCAHSTIERIWNISQCHSSYVNLLL